MPYKNLVRSVLGLLLFVAVCFIVLSADGDITNPTRDELVQLQQNFPGIDVDSFLKHRDRLTINSDGTIQLLNGNVNSIISMSEGFDVRVWVNSNGQLVFKAGTLNPQIIHGAQVSFEMYRGNFVANFDSINPGGYIQDVTTGQKIEAQERLGFLSPIIRNLAPDWQSLAFVMGETAYDGRNVLVGERPVGIIRRV